MNSVKPGSRTRKGISWPRGRSEQGCQKIRTDIVRVELVHAHADGDRRQAQRPSKQRAEHGELALMDVIYQDGVEL